MTYALVFINATVVALMAMYVYQNERRMGELSAKNNQTGNYIIRCNQSRTNNNVYLNDIVGNIHETILKHLKSLPDFVWFELINVYFSMLCVVYCSFQFGLFLFLTIA